MEIAWPSMLNENLIDATLFKQEGSEVTLDFSGNEKLFNKLLEQAKKKGIPFKQHLLNSLGQSKV